MTDQDQDEKKAREVAKSYMLNQQGIMGFDDHVNYLSGLILSALRTAREEEREACAKIADHAVSVMSETALQHDEDSESRDRCHARARQANQIAQLIRSRKVT